MLTVTSACGVFASQQHQRVDNPCTRNWSSVIGPKASLECPDEDALIDFVIARSHGPIALGGLGALTVLACIGTCVGKACCGCFCCKKSRDAAPSTSDTKKAKTNSNAQGQVDSVPADRNRDSSSTSKKTPSQVAPAVEDERDLANVYDRKWVIAVKGMTVIMFVLGLVAMAVSLAGVGQVQSFPNRIASGAKVTLLDWVFGMVQRILVAFSSSEQEQSLNADTPAMRQLATIRASLHNLKSTIDNIAAALQPVTAALTGLAVPAVLVFLASIIGIIAAAARIRAFLPAVSIAFVALSAIPTGLLGAAAGIANVPFSVWCSEVDVWTSRRGPGVFAEYVVPKYCSSRVNFHHLKQQLNDITDKLSNSTCEDLNNRCDSSSKYNNLVHMKIFKCAEPVVCDDVAGLVKRLGQLELKDGTPGMCADPCTISKCATECNGTVRTTSSTIWSSATDANDALKVVNEILSDNYLSCDIIMDRILAAFDFCSTVHAGLSNIYVGAAFGVTVNIILPICMFLGQKFFFKRSAGSDLDIIASAEMLSLSLRHSTMLNYVTDAVVGARRAQKPAAAPSSSSALATGNVQQTRSSSNET